MRTLSRIAILTSVGIACTTSAAEVPAPPEDGGPRNWTVTVEGLNLRAEASTEAEVLTRYPAGTLLSNLGCLRAAGRIWCDVQHLRGGPRGYVAAEFLQPAISPDGSARMGPDDSALRAGRGEFDANGKIGCALADDLPLADCDFGVARAGGGYATVVVTKPDGTKRALFFTMGIPIGADTSEADGYKEFRTARGAEDTYMIWVGEERYEIFDAVVLGG